MVAVWVVQRSTDYLLYLLVSTLPCGVTAALQFRHGSTAAFVSQATATLPATQALFTSLAEDSLDYWKRDDNFCWPLIDPGVATQMFCQCSDYKIRPIITQAPTPGQGYEPCAAYSATATTSSSTASTSSTTSTQKTLSTSVHATSTSISSKPTTRSTSSERKKTSTSVRTSTTTIPPTLVSSSTSSKRTTSSTSAHGPSKLSSHKSTATSTSTSKTSSSQKSSSSSKAKSSTSTKTLTSRSQSVSTTSSSASRLTPDAINLPQSSSQLKSSSSGIKAPGSTSNSSSLTSLSASSSSTSPSATLSFSQGLALAGNPQRLPISSSSAANASNSTPIVSPSPMQASESSGKLDGGCPSPMSGPSPMSRPSPTSSLPVPSSDPSAVVNRRDLEIDCHQQVSSGHHNLSATTNTTSLSAMSPTSTHNPEINGTYEETNADPDLQSQCQDFELHQRQECWEILNVTGFIDDWYAYNQETCQSTSMGFADCFLNLEIKAGVNCSDFTGLSQCPVPDAQTYKGKKHAAQVYYVAFNIWNIHNWFHTYWQALTGANGLTADNIAAVCRLINVPQPKGFPLNEVLSVLAFALGLISPSGWGSKLPAMGSGLRNAFTKNQVPGEYLLRAVQNSPTLSRNLLATGDLSKTEVQIGAISSNLAAIVSQLETNVQNAIVDAMSNLSLFMEFASDGFFSTQIQNINTIQQNLTQALNTYVVSQALQDDNVIITRALDTNVHALATNGTEVGYDLGCSQGYDEWGMCNVWWYDSENNISYGLESWKDETLNFTSVLHDLFNTNITTPEMLFQGSQVCANAASGTQGDPPGSNLTTKTGIWNAECIANLKICTWELGVLSQQQEYTDCPGETQFALEGCGDQTDNEALMPISYLGKWLFGGYEGILCNTLKPGSQQPA